MAKLNETELDLIKRFASHPSGLGYVADFSNQTFSLWFRDTWNVDIDDPKYEDLGTSKGNRLVSFCRQEEDAVVLSVLGRLRTMAHNLGIKQSENVRIRDVNAFDELLARLSRNAKIGADKEVLENVTKSQLLSNAKTNEASLVLVGASALEGLSEFREIVRSDNHLAINNLELRDQLLNLIDALILHIEQLLSILPSSSMLSSEQKDDQIVSWTKRYINGALPKLQEYFAPESLGSSSVPVTVILACGGLGSLLTGFSPIGFGAGSVVGKLIVGEMKSGAAADQITKRLDLDD